MSKDKETSSIDMRLMENIVERINAVPGFDPNMLLREITQEDGSKTFTLPVDARLLWFQLACPNGRLEVIPIDISADSCMFEGRVYFNKTGEKPDSNAYARVCRGDVQADDSFVSEAASRAISSALRFACFGTPVNAVYDPERNILSKALQEPSKVHTNNTISLQVGEGERESNEAATSAPNSKAIKPAKRKRGGTLNTMLDKDITTRRGSNSKKGDAAKTGMRELPNNIDEAFNVVIGHGKYKGKTFGAIAAGKNPQTVLADIVASTEEGVSIEERFAANLILMQQFGDKAS